MAGTNVILVGFMGAGKSTVGRLLARRLHRDFIETDELIEAKEGMPIAAIFAQKGEAHFRALEAELLELLKLRENHVITTGGGLPCQDGAMEKLKSIGTVIWLSGAFDALYSRAQRSGQRPMIQRKSREEVEALYRQREPYYREAHFSVDTARLPPAEVVERILSLIPARPS